MAHNIAFLFMILFSAHALGAEIDLEYVNIAESGGDATVFFSGQSAQAFQQPAPNLSEAEITRHLKGDTFFGRSFSAGNENDLQGLGPVYNNISCTSCHARDGRGALPVLPAGQEWVQLRQNEAIFLRISIENGVTPPKDAAHNWGAPQAVPDFSSQLFHLGSFSVRPDMPGVGQAKVWMKYELSEFVYPDGKTVKLRKPVFRISDAYSPRIYASDVRTSPRMGTPMIGLGLLEAIPESAILALAARDLSSEGIFGKPNYVFDIEKSLAGDISPISLGRFGLKANTPTVLHQSLGALNGDLGVTNFAFPNESILNTPLYNSLALPAPHKPEASQQVAEDLVFYSATLAVPARRDISDPEVIHGAKLFHQVNCTSCHQPSFTTGSRAIVSGFTNQKIFPFTDMLLHDMGEGLADHRQDFDANGRQWKTRPLWGLGHTQTINPRAGFLHDGRARTIEEAILWHDGEARYSKAKFTSLKATDREALLKFIKSL